MNVKVQVTSRNSRSAELCRLRVLWVIIPFCMVVFGCDDQRNGDEHTALNSTMPAVGVDNSPAGSRKGAQKSPPSLGESVTTQEVTWRWLLDPFQTSLEEWQVIGRVRGIAIDVRGHIFLSDTENSRIIHIDENGVLIQVIGREGAGPGEFREPTMLNIDLQRDLLYVVDTALARVSRFAIHGDTADFMDMFPAPQVRGSFPQSFSVADDGGIWASTVSGDFRVTKVNLHGHTTRTFGRQFQPARLLLNQIAYNRGAVHLLEDDQLVFIGIYRPQLERWTTLGELIEVRRFPFEESEKTLKLESSYPPERRAVYCLGSHWNSEVGALIIRTGVEYFYDVDPVEFTVRGRYSVIGLQGFPGPFAYQAKGDSLEIYICDSDGGIKAARIPRR